VISSANHAPIAMRRFGDRNMLNDLFRPDELQSV
jgi:hypothetical protein